MLGKVVRYRKNIFGIVLDYKDGYHLRDPQTDHVRFIKEPLCRVYWLSTPKLGANLFNASEEIVSELDIEEQLSFGFGTCPRNIELIEELDLAMNSDEWFFAKHFVVLEDHTNSI